MKIGSAVPEILIILCMNEMLCYFRKCCSEFHPAVASTSWGIAQAASPHGELSLLTASDHNTIQVKIILIPKKCLLSSLKYQFELWVVIVGLNSCHVLGLHRNSPTKKYGFCSNLEPNQKSDL